MARKRLQQLIWQQHWPVLLVIFMGLLGIGAYQGMIGSQAWQDQSTPQLMASQVRYQRATQRYVDTVGRSYSSKADFIKAYRANQLQLYRRQPTKTTGTVRGKFGTGINQFCFFMSILAGTVMIWVTRKRFFNEFLQSLGYRRAEIYRQQSLTYVGTVALGIAAGSIANLIILWSRIPAAYFAYFNGMTWLKDLTGDILVGSCLIILAGLATMIVNNVLIVFMLGTVAYLGWWVPIAALQNATTHVWADDLSRHWELGCAITILLMGLAWWGSQRLAARYSEEKQAQLVIFNGGRLPLVLILSLPLSIGLNRLLTGIFSDSTDWLSLLIGWLVGLIGLVGWIYRPKWCQRLWQLMA
ncbi:hypothetical protein RA086_07855 [Lactiplantibacillus sp. WILCCON 0030]|uniref:ABC transporter permease n=1 Tax=Lactiplantibacillus brownii TaxID=3069269 RepID=A0ABU1A9E9_9LACO|nr:hypothetical protein [Lactiplantibacillus brownii]MDQ7937542.1 hypothetical protein [Lactiplantibacillus brownii]